jgi:hypothetical protein
LGDETFILRGSRKLRSYPLPPGPLASTGVVPELRVGYPRAKETDWSKEALGNKRNRGLLIANRQRGIAAANAWKCPLAEAL